MFEKEIKRYQNLNSISEQNGIIIFGGEGDKNIPLCELKQAFSIESNLYNRSISGLSVNDATKLYNDCVAPLNPETVLLHIGQDDLNFFKENSNEFDRKYRELIFNIKQNDKKCRIAIVSLKNYENDATVAEINKHLKYLSESEQCEFADISDKCVWNPKATKDVVSFVYSIGFVHSLKTKRPIYDLVKILFCSETALA